MTENDVCGWRLREVFGGPGQLHHYVKRADGAEALRSAPANTIRPASTTAGASGEGPASSWLQQLAEPVNVLRRLSGPAPTPLLRHQ